ncbi:response regulator transcription factor [Levilactobacillus namurensis]|uniref:response regulator transcription factor n=1 Tax=Levilactobacillus namurensis TaxID=380393 RepID=UPI00222F8DF9|nr:response regulator transcription factor [Levilactobacillus namurensis]MCW3778639.1 response regulator transcription factor [Levilactobacillus namurensis]MDT7018008.1 response regulator transcription factor [Levilactobacillus namurensis]WNN64996.1 response regulator transcription factor [Levilactobacillus namurensis]
MSRVLVVDDEPAIVTLLQYNLEQADYQVVTAIDGEQALQLAQNEHFDVILLDLMLPKLDGVEVTKRLRQEKIKTPIIMITAKTSEFDTVFGLELGADDYITKPFSPREVLARMKAVMRRYHEDAGPVTTATNGHVIRIAGLRIDQDKFQVKRGDQPIDLTPKEFELLLFFAKRPGKVWSREQLLEGVWGFDYSGQTRMVDIHVSHLREKIEADPKHPQLLKTVRGFGYTFEASHE